MPKRENILSDKIIGRDLVDNFLPKQKRFSDLKKLSLIESKQNNSISCNSGSQPDSPTKKVFVNESERVLKVIDKNNTE